VAAVLSGLERCRQLGASVVNLSLSGLDSATSDELQWLGDYTATLRDTWNINVVAGAGNNGGAVGYPARLPEVFGIGAADAAGNLCGFSNRGAGLDITALGCGVELSWPGGGLGLGSGTSYSTPIVSAVLAALRAYRADIGAAEAEQLVLSAAHGRIDASFTFTRAGLGWLTSAPASTPKTRPATQDQTPVSAPRNHDDGLLSLGIDPPKVRSAVCRAGILTVRVSGVPDFGRAVFRVEGRPFVRRSGLLRIKCRRAPRRVSASIHVPDVGTTAPVTVRVRSAAQGSAGMHERSSRSTEMPSLSLGVREVAPNPTK
jgi:hypothetical protein